MENFRVLCICSFIFSFVRTSSSLDSITPSQSIRDGETLVSAGGTFELGFFSPGNSKNRYVGVWYKNISPLTVVWVANREIPVNDASGVLKFNDHGVLLLLNATNSSVWSSYKSTAAENPIAQLLDSGNLVVKNGPDTNEENLLWQSFDHPCDTLLPGMKLGRNLVTGLDRFLSSWKNVDDPSEGEYMLKMDLRGYPQVVQTRGPVIKARAGSWNGNGFTGYPLQKPNPVFKFYFVLSEKEIYYEYQVWNQSLLTRYIVNSFGIGQRFSWTSQTSSWELVSTSPSDQCENYAVCGGYSMCNMGTAPICACLKGFISKKPEEWNASYWSNGCVLRTKLDCKSDGFQKYAGMKLPDTSSSWYSKTMSLGECQKSCLKNCSCTAYANLDIRDGGSGCLLWFDDLTDMRQFPQGGQDLYIRLPASELGNSMFSYVLQI